GVLPVAGLPLYRVLSCHCNCTHPQGIATFAGSQHSAWMANPGEDLAAALSGALLVQTLLPAFAQTAVLYAGAVQNDLVALWQIGVRETQKVPLSLPLALLNCGQ